MDNPFILIAGIIAVGLLFVVAPVVFDTYRRFRNRKVITCPESHGLVEVSVDPGRAAFGAAFGKAMLRITSCSLWPKKIGCARKCIKENWPTP
jgi:hypothetical protein